MRLLTHVLIAALVFLCATPRTAFGLTEHNNGVATAMPTTAREIFSGDWKTDDALLTELVERAQKTQPGSTACDFLHASHFRSDKKTVAKVSAAVTALTPLHKTIPGICVLKWGRLDVMQFHGRIVMTNDAVKKFTEDELIAAAAHEIGHGYEMLAFRRYEAGMLPEMEHFSDIVAAWTLMKLGRNPRAVISLLKRFPDADGTTPHPKHAERFALLTAVIESWEKSPATAVIARAETTRVIK